MLEREIEVCLRLATKCIFPIGFARSNTTITQQIINSAQNALVLGEANFHLQKDVLDFRSWYNAKHIGFHNQTTKSTHAPNFVPTRDHQWWEWLEAASEHYDLLGDKIALSAHTLGACGQEETIAFFEARFFKSKYIFILRNPIDTLASLIKLSDIRDDSGVRCQCDAWLQFLQLWADWIRIFPNTLTLIGDTFDRSKIADISDFTGLNIEGSEVLLDDRNRRNHEFPSDFVTISEIGHELMGVYDLAKVAASEDRRLWQAEQKRTLFENNSRGDDPGQIAVVPRSLGSVWAKSQNLRALLREKQ